MLGGTAAIVVVSLIDGRPLYAVIAGWPLVALLMGADGPMLRSRIVAFVRLVALLVAGMVAGMIYNLVSAPILPSTTVMVAPKADGAEADSDVSRLGPGAIRWLRGFTVSVDDESTTMLLEQGGIAIIPNANIRTRVLCPSVTDLPGGSPNFLGLPLQDSGAASPRPPAAARGDRGSPVPHSRRQLERFLSHPRERVRRRGGVAAGPYPRGDARC
ncbi:hypothetical protein [Paractinoplanes toevensis]|uniref:Uncharacterized protein n=1 Tax=Paractinoplanes toevensis TaxID=571911 RepID=A0A919W4X4_9ACTN|nr:hypothetical protein [Actinoplanes toevensis]GIM92195.1 hypothetical protein Ato02nite_039880 [Actinoplanes toevensis]